MSRVQCVRAALPSPLPVIPWQEAQYETYKAEPSRVRVWASATDAKNSVANNGSAVMASFMHITLHAECRYSRNTLRAFSPKIFRFAVSLKNGNPAILPGTSKSQCGQSDAYSNCVSA